VESFRDGEQRASSRARIFAFSSTTVPGDVTGTGLPHPSGPFVA